MEHIPHDLDLEARRDAFLATYHKEVVTVTTDEIAEVWADVKARNARTSFSALELLHEADLEGQDRDTEEATAHRYADPQR